MTAKEKRDRLLKNRPKIRPLVIYEDSQYHKDLGILWAAHKAKTFSFLDKETTQEEFAKNIEEISGRMHLLLAEDDCPAFDSGRGPVCLIAVESDGWRIEPHAEFFGWSSKKNILRVTVAFLHWLHYQKIGICIIRCLQISKNLFDHCQNYGVLFYVGKVIGGQIDGDEFLYSIMGKANPKRNRGKTWVQ